MLISIDFNVHVGNQIIEFPEFVDLMARRRWGERQNGNEDELRAAFSHFDPDSQGQVSLAELRHAMTNIGEKLKDEEIDEMFQFMVKDGEGKASLDGKKSTQPIYVTGNL